MYLLLPRMRNGWKKDLNSDDGNAEVIKPGLSKKDNNDNIQYDL